MILETIALKLLQKFVLDPACSVAKEEVEDFFEEHLDDDGKKAMDAVVDAMPDNTFKSVKDFLQ
jgi:hypothetical protein